MLVLRRFHPQILAFVAFLFAGFIDSGGLFAQDENSDPETSVEETQDSEEEKRIASAVESLAVLLETIEAKELELNNFREEAELSDDSAVQAELEKKIELGLLEITELEKQFDSISGGVDLSAFDDEEPSAIDLQTEAIQLLGPIIEDLKRATATPREIEQLRHLETVEETRREEAVKALEHTKAVIAGSENEQVNAKLRESLKIWNDRLTEAENQLTVIRHQREMREQSQESFFEKGRKAVLQFFRNRGWHLLMGISAFVTVYGVLRWLYRRLHVIPLVRKRKERSFYGRLADVLFNIMVVIISLGTMVFVFYWTNDLLLLSLTLVFVVGMCWGGARVFPALLEQIRLLLNLGSIRENERVIFEGLPWRIDSLSLYTIFRNPELVGGYLRLPLKMLVGMHSRPYSESESWFPTKTGHWVMLDDGSYGKIVLQSPEEVCLEAPGGAVITYETKRYLALNPKNLSSGFRIAQIFRIDYRHRTEATGRIPEVMRESLESELASVTGNDELVQIHVEIEEAGPGSIDYKVEVDLAGSAAAKYFFLKRAVARILIDVCNREGWEIPYQKVQIMSGADQAPDEK